MKRKNRKPTQNLANKPMNSMPRPAREKKHAQSLHPNGNPTLPLRANITVYDENGENPKRWVPCGPMIKATSKSSRSVEVRIMHLVLDGRFPALKKAIALIKKGVDYDWLIELSRECKKTGRLLKTLLRADEIISGKIPKEECDAEIRGLSISAGHS